MSDRNLCYFGNRWSASEASERTEGDTMEMWVQPAGNRALRLLALSLLCTAFVVALAAAPARADFGVQSFSLQVTKSDGTTPEMQAGAHADVTTSITFKTDASGNLEDNVKGIHVGLPVGLAGYQPAIPECAWSDLTTQGLANCPIDTQVGVADLVFSAIGAIEIPVFNLNPREGDAADLGFNLFGFVYPLRAHVRATDYGLDVDSENVSEVFGLVQAQVTLWGVPADPAHDAHRYFRRSLTPGASSGAPEVAFTRNPTSCGQQLEAHLDVNAWQEPANHQFATSPVGPFADCDRLHFDPDLTVRPTVTAADAPSGYTVDLKVPQNDNPDGLATADLRDAVVTLPQGVALSPAAADGLGSCTQAQIGIGSGDLPSKACEAAKIGEATLTTPALPDRLTGGIYLGAKGGNAPAPITGPPYTIFLVISGDGVTIKLQGSVDFDRTGRLRTTFANNPQQPFSDLTLMFKGGPRAPLTTPAACGTFTTTSDLTPWSGPGSGPAAMPFDSFNISWDGQGGACPAALPFSPAVSAGVMTPLAGRSSPFVFRLTRGDRTQRFGQVRDVVLPPGVIGAIKGIPQCSDAQAEAGTCSLASQIGTVEAGAGPGSRPLYLPGKVFLTTGYKGAPFGLSIVVPAVAGPFDLGIVKVRAAVDVDPTTAQLKVSSDPLPTILGGIPLDIRDIALSMDRPGFMRTPTRCAPMRVTADAVSVDGTVAPLSNPFQVGGCAALPYSPALRLRLTGKSQTRDGEHPGVDAVLTQRAGQANNRRVRVALPLSLALDPNNAEALCEFTDGLKDRCPSSSIVGSATATTPLLNKPLSGPVYFVKGVRVDSKGVAHKTLPTLLVTLRGEIALDLRAKSTVSNKKLVTTFASIPDAPVRNFHLKINGGKHGILVVTGGKNICKATQTAMVQSDGQNGKHHDFATRIGTPCGLQVISATHTSRSVHVKVGGLGKGKLTVTGMGVRRTSRNIRSSTIATVIAPLTAAGRVHRSTRVRVRFDPAGPAKAKTVSARVR